MTTIDPATLTFPQPDPPFYGESIQHMMSAEMLIYFGQPMNVLSRAGSSTYLAWRLLSLHLEGPRGRA